MDLYHIWCDLKPGVRDVALVEAAEEWAVVRGLGVMSLRSNQLRTDAHKFYEHLGYTVIKTQNAFRKSLVY